MTQATRGQYAELVGYTGVGECIEIRECTDTAQVWDYDFDYGVGLGLGTLGYWVGNAHGRGYVFIGGSRHDVEAEYEGYLGVPVRWIA